jgi:hypothetical protein
MDIFGVFGKHFIRKKNLFGFLYDNIHKDGKFTKK